MLCRLVVLGVNEDLLAETADCWNIQGVEWNRLKGLQQLRGTKAPQRANSDLQAVASMFFMWITRLQ
jgi:hypothetical protein